MKQIIDTLDPHMRPVKVYQWFDGMSSLSERFLLFKGQINSPVVWNERDRTLSFVIISQIESAEVGFSIEEGNFVNPSEELIGKPWPLVFGTCINVPALRLTTPYRGTLGQGFGIADPTLDLKIQAANNLLCPKVWEQKWVATGPTNPTKAITDYPHYRAYFFETTYPGALQVRVYGEAIGGAIPEIRYNPPDVQINGVTIFDGVEFNCSAPAGSPGTAQNPQAGVVTVSLDKPFNKKVNRGDRFEWYQGATSPPAGSTDQGGYYKKYSTTTPECRNEKCRLIEDLEFQKEQQIAVQRDSIIILNGKNFPQGTNLILNINEAILEGRFEGTQDDPSNLFRIVRMQHPDYATLGTLTYTQLQAQILQDDLDMQLVGSECEGSGGQPADLGAIYEKYQDCLEDAGEDEAAITQCKNTFDNSYYKWKFNGSENAKAEYTREVYNSIPQSEFFWASPGAEVKGVYDVEVVYLVNLASVPNHSCLSLPNLGDDSSTRHCPI
ncbi:MAG: hypothetical protein HC888_15225 [Candidatus Competibacteraceae bacterium]|nr:hypothetical protein [Candidatus Competibacteraceae bacterium]